MARRGHATTTGTTDRGSVSDGEVIEIDGLLWKPKPGATSSGEEFRRARSLVIEWDAEFEARHAERDRQRAARVALYDEGREQARLALLEQQAILRHQTEELDGLRERQRFPAMPEERRREQIAELERSVADVDAEVGRLQEVVGDVETVVDRRGWLPQDRRELALTLFSARRCTEVQELRARVKEREASLKATKGHAERAPIRDALHLDRQRLEFLMAIPRLEAADMCSECALPAGWHGYVTTGANREAGPCPAWPRWAQRIRKVREMLAAAVKDKPAEPPPPKPKPLAVIASGLPIAEVMRQLADIQAKYPESRVRRGNRNRWEIWPE